MGISFRNVQKYPIHLSQKIIIQNNILYQRKPNYILYSPLKDTHNICRFPTVHMVKANSCWKICEYQSHPESGTLEKFHHKSILPNIYNIIVQYCFQIIVLYIFIYASKCILSQTIIVKPRSKLTETYIKIDRSPYT